MKAFLDYIPPNEAEGESIGELQFDEHSIEWSNISPEEAKQIQRQRHDIYLPNGEILKVKAQNVSGNFFVSVQQNGEFLAQVTNSNSGTFAFRTLSGATIGMDIFEE